MTEANIQTRRAEIADLRARIDAMRSASATPSVLASRHPAPANAEVTITEEEPGILDTVTDTASDILLGAGAGVIDGVINTANFLGRGFSAMTNTRPAQVIAAGIDPRLTDTEKRKKITELMQQEDENLIPEDFIPTSFAPDTTAANIARGISRNIVGIVGAGKVTAGLKILRGGSKVAAALHAAGSGALGAAMANSEKDQTLMGELGFSAFEVTPSDSFAEARAKHAMDDIVTGAVLGLGLKGVSSGWNSLKAARAKGRQVSLKDVERVLKEKPEDAQVLASHLSTPEGQRELAEGIARRPQAGTEANPPAPAATQAAVQTALDITDPEGAEFLSAVRQKLHGRLTDILMSSASPEKAVKDTVFAELAAMARNAKDKQKAVAVIADELSGQMRRNAPQHWGQWIRDGINLITDDPAAQRNLLAALADAPDTTAFVRNTIIPARLLLASAYKEADELSERIVCNLATDRDFLYFDIMWDELRQLQRMVSDTGTEAGRLLAAFGNGRRSPARKRRGSGKKSEAADTPASPNETERPTREKLAAMSDEELSKFLRGMPDLKARMREIAKRNYILSPEQSLRFLRRIQPSTPLRWIHAHFVHSILTGPQTHGWNIVSNIVKGGLSDVNKILGGTLTGNLDIAREGVDTMISRACYVSDAWKAARTAWNLDMPIMDAASKTELVGGFSPMSAQAIMAARPDGGEAWKTFAHVLGLYEKAISLSSRAMTAEDEFFKQISARATLRAQALRRGRQLLGKNASRRKLAEFAETQVNNFFDARGRLRSYQDEITLAEARNAPKEELDRLYELAEESEYALLEAQRNTFTQALGKAGTGVQNAVNGNALFGFVFPFVRTPLNILKDGFAHCPTGLLNLFRQEIRNDPRARAEVVGKVATGLFMGVSAYYMARNGLITGAYPKNRAEAEKWRMEGIPEYSIKTPFGWVSYKKVDPAAMIIGSVATLATVSLDDTEGENARKELLEYCCLAIADNIVDKSFFSGFNDIMQAINLGAPESLSRWAGRTGSAALVPYSGLRGFAARIYDGSLHEAQGFVENFVNNTIPASLPPRYNWISGEVMTAASPWPAEHTKQNAVFQELIRQGGVRTGPTRELSGVELNSEQYSRLCQLTGSVSIGNKTLMQRLETLFNSKSYKRRPDAPEGEEGWKQKRIEALMNAYIDRAKRELQKEYPDLKRQVREKRLEALRILQGKISGNSRTELLNRIMEAPK